MTDDRAGGPLRVLLVEDNPGDVHLIREGVESAAVDASLTVVSDGESALEYLAESAAATDLVLLDLNVPKVNGRDLLEEVDTDPEFPSVPVAVLTSSKSPMDVVETRELGADGYFVKPVDPNEFIETVQTICESAVTGRLPAGEYADHECE